MSLVSPEAEAGHLRLRQPQVSTIFGTGWPEGGGGRGEGDGEGGAHQM